ncbi:MAG: hypothetical protein O2894_05845 [Planctomycetota bacterium]|nr:hypothetical protein [Planctomycetota bacterium]
MARRMFRDAWAEQVGPISVPADPQALRSAAALADVGDDHPFAVIYTSIQDGSLRGSDGVLDKIVQYHRAGAITDDEVRQAKEMIDKSVWLGDLAISGGRP